MQKIFSFIKNLLLIGLLVFLQNTSVSGANEIHKAILHEYNDSTYLILHLFNFHPTGGSYEQGNLRTAGYNDSEIQVINLSSQKIIAHEKFGEYNYEGAFEILGGSDQLIWLYSMQQKSGLQALNLFTLKKEVSQAHIYSNMNEWIGRFSYPDWHEIDANYGFNEQSGNLLLTNYKGHKYFLNPKTYELSEIALNKEYNQQNINYLWKVVYEGKDTLDLYDEYIHINNLKQLPDHHFIEGSFLVEQNAKIQYSNFQKWLIDYSLELDVINSKLSRIHAKKDSKTYKDLLAKKEWLTLKKQDSKDNIEAIELNLKPDKLLLRTSDNAFYAFQRDNKSTESSIAIVKVAQKKDDISIEWKTPIHKMYYNVSAVQNYPEFKRYFNNQVPDPSFFFIQQFDEKILIVYLLQACIIDTQTGEIIWRTKL